MAKQYFVQCRVSAETKEALRAVAEHQRSSESELLHACIDTVLRFAGNDAATVPPPQPALTARDGRLTIRLAPDDQRLLTERAATRRLPPATYVSVLVRAHLRELTPLPEAEFTAFKQAVAEMGAIGRALQQIARAAEVGARITGPDREGFAAFLKIAESLRGHMKALLKANAESWERGYVDHER